ncbi:histone-like nucleoid-structuring protein Lsr2 [Mycobacteroides immunogenum]|uniref:Nucleoid-associated protein Lsr2 n=1 Tax=Mycobacteroides immunogenum TaxID=83262 RepID=A0A7V8LQV4_9MYCO|nr:Lsr2 family protein [Mycobacteroides immunogenum]KPG13842.1 nucleoid-associated protein Lsr2 [Mycobacteroides immunogenum]KPG14240.1 nucleoid-associated protein Lsr2 [Mycobacteroides immunogenum]KPG17623.1 nucleoid-associated protein Lsr2 [Mycobacteroides immunogenum]KPG23933.1 nucleoid-associated protein Lsr2 [Mycobacteroides immunogenum]KPG38973.1 nucleoid-associated protein Lsr2 [Mycobacteroides immunogenum]
MAKKVNVTFVDDIDESPAEGTVEFAIDGVTYEIDLSTKNGDKLRKQLQPWIDHARRVSGRRRTGRPSSGRPRAKIDRAQSVAIREWAAKNGHTISSRGRIPETVFEAFTAAN